MKKDWSPAAVAPQGATGPPLPPFLYLLSLGGGWKWGKGGRAKKESEAKKGDEEGREVVSVITRGVISLL